MKGYYIEITNNLLDPKHRKKIGSAIWEFMWCLDKMTSVSEDGTGKVLGGKPIKLSEIKEEIGIAENHISENLNKLKNEGYINLSRAPYGLCIEVNKAKKRFNKKVKTDEKRINEKVKSSSKKVISNKTYTDDNNNITRNEVASNDIKETINAFKNVNPSYEELFRNTTQRKVSGRLIKKYGKEQVMGFILACEKCFSEPYAPTITTPYQLERDLGKLRAFYGKQKNKGQGNKSRIIK